MSILFRLAPALAATILISGCATEQSRSVEVVKVAAASSASQYQGKKSPISIGKFDNRSSFMRGIFSDGTDRLGGQAKTILMTHLQQTGRFNVLDRSNMEEIAKEANIARKTQSIKGSEFVITGDVTEFGRKEVGDQQLWGVLGRGKTQVAYAKVSLNVVNVETSEVIFSTQGAGEYSLSAREVVGFGGTASYDSTLNGKVLDLAIREAVDNLAKGIDSGAFKVN
jgi:curli biogenesis system outer membrane secretion channel CsgG